jgi:hypothetical protein
MLALKHKLFEIDPRTRFFWGLGAALREFDRVRRRAGDFAGEIGAENVVSIAEHTQPRFTVVVWYREEKGARAARADEFFEAFASH